MHDSKNKTAQNVILLLKNPKVALKVRFSISQKILSAFACRLEEPLYK